MTDLDEIPTPAARALVVKQSRAIAEQSDQHATTLESILAILRSPRLSDSAARAESIEVATSALVRSRSTAQRQHDLLLEPVSSAFSRLRAELRPLVRFGELDVQFVEPPATGRALPGDVAHDARAIVRTAVLGLLDAGAASRARVQWDCDGRNLLIEIRDNGLGELKLHDDVLRPIAERVVSLAGRIQVDSTSGWGSLVTVTLPLDPPNLALNADGPTDLTPREAEVLRLLATGVTNRQIAVGLGITPNTVKYHVGNLLRKYGANTRAELAAIAHTTP